MVSHNYLFIAALMCAAIGFAAAPLMIVRLIAPRKRSAVKADIYECGVATQGETWVRFRIQYYLYALMFVVFDIETVFLYPWAASYGQIGPIALAEMMLFLVVLSAALAYAWAKGVLRWV